MVVPGANNTPPKVALLFIITFFGGSLLVIFNKFYFDGFKGLIVVWGISIFITIIYDKFERPKYLERLSSEVKRIHSKKNQIRPS